MASIVPVWVLVLVVAVIIAVFTPSFGFYTWLPVTLAASIVLTFVVQLSLRRKEGFVGRLVLTSVGSLIILGIATLLLAVTR